jgi:hypothetical protein
MEFKVGDRVRICDGSADHWRTGVICSIYAYTDVSNHLVLLDGEDECCGYSAHDLELIPQESEAVFKVGDRVEVSNPNDFHYGCAGVISGYVSGSMYVVDLADGLADAFLRTELRHLPPTHTRGTHPKSLANLAPGQERRADEWEEKRLRLSTGACDWLRKQGRGNMSRAVERLIMEKISKEEGEGS